ncbi:MAG: OmpA family protein [Elusimicrobia bacterium]|nr:OmpA family protein [Elusimicrobiota bacterium]MDE2510278.1 OmpA family protein [Elusimicrobiota bacterium]
MRKPGLTWGALIVTSFLAAACAGNRAVKKVPDVPAAPVTGPAAPSPTDAARSMDMEPDVRDMATREVPELKVVGFAYDSDILDESARATLKTNAAYLRDHADMKIQVAGNCDQRGTVAYNLALGQRRAAAVRSYYKALGVADTRVATISYGKEKLICTESTDACWQRNRRAVTLEVLSPNIAGQPVLR